MKKTKDELRALLDQFSQDYKIAFPLTFNCKIGIRFDLQNKPQSTVNSGDDLYFQHSMNRAVRIFESTFEPQDQIFLIIISFKRKRNKIRRSNFIFKQIEHLKSTNISYKRIKDPYNEGEKYLTYNQALISCVVSSVNYREILSGIINSDFGLRKPNVGEIVLFINERTQTILHVYDDRGLDIISAEKESLWPIFTKHKDWVLDIDFEEIAKLFQNKN